MAKYSDIKGFTVQTLSTDTVANQFAGGSWASGGAIPVNINSGVGFGTQTASVIGGGYDGSSYPSNVYEYDGSSWTSGGSLTASVGQARTGHGVLTAGGAVAGYKESGNAVIANYEQYDGTSFTEQNDLNTARQTLAAAGSTTAALAVGGTTGVGPGSTQTGLTNVESYNGSSWTETTENNTGRKQATSFSGGPAPTMIFIGGASGSTLYANVETYNGSAWTETTDLNTARSALAGAGQAQTDGLVFGGSAPSATAVTEQWNGTSWTELADLGTARHSLVGSGTGAASALAAGGGTSALTEEFTAPAVFNQITEGQLFFNSTTNTFKETIKDAPTGTWASGGNMNTGRQYGLITSVSGGPSGQSDALAVSGEAAPGNVANVEFYNGTAWTETTDVNTARRLGNGCGGQPAAVVAGGYTSGDVASTEVWDGSSWTETGDLNSAKRQFAGSFGSPDSSSDLLVAGAFPLTANTEIWDGSSWTETGNLNQQRYDGAGFGVSSTAGLIAGGQSSPSPIPGQTAYAENWNGSSWTEVAEFNTNRMYLAAAGEQTDGFIFGGSLDPGASTTTEIWNGSSWTELNDLSTGVLANSGGGSSVAAISFAGGRPTITTASEEWTASLANKTITAS